MTLFSLGERGTGLIYLPNIAQTSKDTNTGGRRGEGGEGRREAAGLIST